jgi:hypothetical protein
VNDDVPKSIGTILTELRELVISYVREEITAPLRGAAQYLRLGLIGAALGVVAGVVASVGLLRLAQTAHVRDVDRGAWSWLVYLVVGLGLMLLGVVFVVASVRSGRRQEA